MDSDSHQSIPFVHVYIKGDYSGTVTNKEGGFIVKLDSVPRTLVFSHIAYTTKEIEIISSNPVELSIELSPRVIQLDEVTIIPDKVKNIILNAYNQGVKSLKSKKNADLFYRQVTKTGNTYSEFIEAFYSGRISTAGLEDMKMMHGRFAKLPNDSINLYPRFTNFYYYSSIPIIQEKIKDVVFPITRNFHDYYDYKIKKIIDTKSKRSIAIITFSAKTNKIIIFEGDVYVDMNSYNILKMKGTINHDMGLIFESAKLSASNAKFFFDASFNNSDDGTPVLGSIKTEFMFDLVSDNKIEKVLITSNLVVYAYKGKFKKGKNKRLNKKRDLIADIEKTKFDPNFWENNPIIKRTPLEEKIIKSFEESGTFSNSFK